MSAVNKHLMTSIIEHELPKIGNVDLELCV